ncbi:DddA-like double-stranded DNA deaminase toxin [Actinokineospora pegani]|uniref:DddA-like double-stranded DNA deaminase toxin n=1 Tax=Actinokineospora pegani TaxID=2654637 RepID=UPI0012EA84EE|nr:DddA-like double-stranded DNA deaminase toxin [Actinokineospora pegani]
MSLLSAYATTLQRALATLGKATESMTTAATHLTNSGTLLATLTDHPTTATAHDYALDDLARAHARTTEAAALISGYLAAIWAPAPHPRVAHLPKYLPEPITRPGTGRKTHGNWQRSDGQTGSTVSGRSSEAQLARDYLAHHTNDDLLITEHVEMKIAAELRHTYLITGQVHHMTLALNNLPCRGLLSCEAMLPRILPPGSSITIHAPNGYYRTFCGAR